MARGDIGDVLVIWQRLMAEGHASDPRFQIGDPEAMRAEMAHWFDCFQPFPPAYLDQRDGVIVGWISGLPTPIPPMVSAPKTARIENLWVHPEHRRVGIGTALVAAWSRDAIAQGCVRLEVGTLGRDSRAVSFWRQQGFGDWKVILSRETVPARDV